MDMRYPDYRRSGTDVKGVEFGALGEGVLTGHGEAVNMMMLKGNL